MKTNLDTAYGDWLTIDPSVDTNGPFADMYAYMSANNLTDMFDGLPVTYQDLDLAYMSTFSGQKTTSKLVDQFLDDDNELTSIGKSTIGGLLYRTNFDRWSKLAQTLLLSYDPIQNYDMTEVMTDDETVHEKGTTTTRTDNLSETRTPNLTTTTHDAVYGFNAAIPSPSSTDNQTVHGIDTNTYGGTQTYAATGSDTDTRNYTLTRSGNIGVTTTQDMINSERSVAMWDMFRDVIFPDIDKLLTISVYY